MLIINTRPVKQAESLTRLLENNGYQVADFPLLEIKGNIETANGEDYLLQLSRADIVIFISANAVSYFFEQLLPLTNNSWVHFAKTITTAVIGKSTAKIFYDYSGFNPDIIPAHGSDSESLLKDATFQNIKDKNIVIIRGKGGREYLAQQLTLSGAQVSYLEIYQRLCPKLESSEEKNLLELWNKQSIGFIIITSTESLNNFLTIIKAIRQVNGTLIKSINLLVIHPKIKAKAEQFGFTGKIIVSENANNLSLLKALNIDLGRS